MFNIIPVIKNYNLGNKKDNHYKFVRTKQNQMCFYLLFMVLNSGILLIMLLKKRKSLGPT